MQPEPAQTLQKQRLLSCARAAGVLPALDAVRFLIARAQSAESNRRFLKAHPDFSPPPLWWMHDMYRHTSFEEYWRVGEALAAGLLQRIDANLGDARLHGDRPRVADWGCGLARVLRHMPDRYARTGFDYNRRAIAWCADHIDGPSFLQNALRPPLPAGGGAFDAVYAISVFTHLSEPGHRDWAGEIFRVLAPGGIFLATFHAAPPAGQLLPREQAAFDAGSLVVRGGVKEGSRTYVAYHPAAYVRDGLLRDFEILEGPTEFCGQALFVARRP